MKSLMKLPTVLVLAGALGGCMTQVQGLTVSQPLPAERALAYLQDLDASFNAPGQATNAPACRYSETSIGGNSLIYLVVGVASNPQPPTPFQTWRVSDIHKVDGLAGPFYTVVLINGDGAKCAPLRSVAGTPEATVMPKIEETLTALVSLGVAYTPQ